MSRAKEDSYIFCSALMRAGEKTLLPMADLLKAAEAKDFQSAMAVIAEYGYGDGKGEKIMNPVTVIEMGENSYFEMETAQIRGVDSTNRKTIAKLADGATLIVGEKLLTHGTQQAITEFEIDLYGEKSSAHVVSRSVAQDDSYQEFISRVYGNNECNGHTECDAIVMNNAKVTAIPEIKANHTEASLIHEAAIGKIAGEQLIKLMTLGLTEKEAEEQIISGFLK